MLCITFEYHTDKMIRYISDLLIKGNGFEGGALMGLIIAWTALGLFVGCWVGNTVNKN